jgi:hypothetical protein
VFRLDADLLQCFRLTLQFDFAGGKLAHTEHVGQNVGVLCARKLPGPVCRHGDADSLEEVADGEAVPVGKELAAGERRSGFSAAERGSVT